MLENFKRCAMFTICECCGSKNNLLVIDGECLCLDCLESGESVTCNDEE